MIRHLPMYEEYPRHVDVMQELIRQGEIKSMAEIGVLWGDLSKHLAPMVDLYIMVDPWGKYPDEWRDADSLSLFDQGWWDKVYEVALQKIAMVSGRCKVFRTSSSKAAKYVPDESLDCVFIDALHHYAPMLIDIEAWLPKVKPDGLICGHDWWSGTDQYSATMEGVKRAVLDSFPLEIIHASGQWDHVWLVYKEDIG